MGPDGSHNSAGDFPTQCILPAEFTPTGYQKEDYFRSGDGLHERWGDFEYGMVAIYEFDDVEHWALDWTRRVVGDRDGSGDTGVEGVDPFLRWRLLSCRLFWRVYIFFCFSVGNG